MQTHDHVERILETVTIPTLPGVVAKINELLNDPDAGMPEVGEAVVQDASISAKVLRMANSAFYSLSNPVASVHQAALVLGAQVLKNIVLQASVIRQYEHLQSSPEMDLNYTWKHSALTAQVSRRLASWCQAAVDGSPEDHYTAGLLHDIGKIVMLDSFGQDYLTALREGRESGKSQPEAEIERFGFAHAEVGALVADHWKLPQTLVDVIHFHHDVAGDSEHAEDVLLISVADRIANLVGREQEVEPGEVASAETCARIGLEAMALQDALEEAREAWGAIEI